MPYKSMVGVHCGIGAANCYFGSCLGDLFSSSVDQNSSTMAGNGNNPRQAVENDLAPKVEKA